MKNIFTYKTLALLEIETKGWKSPICLPDFEKWTKSKTGKFDINYEKYGRIFHMVECKVKDTFIKFEQNATQEVCKKLGKDKGKVTISESAFFLLKTFLVTFRNK